MKTKLSSSLLLLILIVNLVSPVVVYANNNSQKNKNKQESTTKPNNGNKKLDTTIIPTPSVLGNTSETYGYQVVSMDLPASLSVNKLLKTSITLKNTSSFNWSKQDVKLTYHWVDENGEYEVFRGDVTGLVKDIGVGQTSSSQTISLKAPSIPGSFKLRIDLIKGNTWFSDKTSYKFEKNVLVNGTLQIDSYESEMLLNDGAEFANSANLKATVTPYPNQPGSENASFIYDYVQFTESPEEDILNGTAMWSKWHLLPDPWNTSSVNFTIKDTSVGVKKIFMRYRAIKKHSNATPETYGEAIYHYGRSEKTTDIYYVDEIFFDNVPPVGNLTINNGAASTTSRTGSLQISASDTVNGVEGSGLNGMRLTNNCNVNDLESNNWSEWESEVTNKENFNLGDGNIMTVCVQVRDKAGNVATFSDTITLYTPPIFNNGGTPGNGGIYDEYYNGGMFEVGNYTYIDGSGRRVVNKLAGTKDNPFGNKTTSTLGAGKIYIESKLVFGTRVNNVVRADIPSPEITYIDVNDDNSKVTIYGIGIQKYFSADFEVKYETLKEGCTPWLLDDCKEIKYSYENHSLEHVGLQLMEDAPWWWFGGDFEINWIWNDSSNGQWIIEMNLNDPNQHNLNINDIVYAKSWAWGGFDSEVDSLGYIDYGAGDRVVSGDSNHELIQQMASYYDSQLENTFGTKITNGTRDWSEIELFWLGAYFESIPDQFKPQNAKIIEYLREEGDSEDCALASSSSVDTIMKIYFDFTSGGYCDENYNRIGQEEFSMVLLHESAHAWGVLHKEIEKEFGTISWKDSGKDYPCYTNRFCNIYVWNKKDDTIYSGVSLNRDQELAIDFVTPYAGEPFPDTFNSPWYEAYLEDFAESVTFYYYRRDRYTNSRSDSLLKVKQEFLSNKVF